MSQELPHLSSANFTFENGVQRNGVFLLENIFEPPFVRPVSGWKIVAYGEAPWPGGTHGFAVMLEKQTPEEEHGGLKGEDFPEGTRLWQHYQREWLNDEAKPLDNSHPE
jgi:hypothetical protein